MHNSIDIFHNEEKILSSFDNLFYRKSIGKWEEVKYTNVFKGTKNPESFSNKDDVYLNSKNNDYYIQYEEIKNYIKNSEDFTADGWQNLNNTFNIVNKSFPKSRCKKMIPTQDYGKHSISYDFNNDVSDDNYWCFSIYVLPNEFNYFQLSLTDAGENNGVKGIFSITLDATRRIVINSKIESIGNISYFEYDSDCIGVDKITEEDKTTGEKFSYYRVYISFKYKTNDLLRSKFSILKNSQGNILEEFSNENDFAGLFINSAQLSKTKLPIEYIKSNGITNSYLKFKALYKKEEGQWVDQQSRIYYGSEMPSKNLGQLNDLYFVNPILQLSNFNRFGLNPSFKCWIYSDDIQSITYYYTQTDKPKEGDTVYEYDALKDTMIPAKKTFIDPDTGEEWVGYINVYKYDDETKEIYFTDFKKKKVKTIKCNYVSKYVSSTLSKWNGEGGPYYSRHRDFNINPLKIGDYIFNENQEKIGVVGNPPEIEGGVIKDGETMVDKSNETIDLTDWEYNLVDDVVYIYHHKTTIAHAGGDIILPNLDDEPIKYYINLNKEFYVLYTAKRNSANDRRIIFEDKIVYWNEDKDTYSYMSNTSGKVLDNNGILLGYVGKKIKLRINNENKIVIDESVPYKDVLSVLNIDGTLMDRTYIRKDGKVFSFEGNLLGYSDIKIYDLKFGNKSMYDFKQINNAIAFSTNLFNQTYTARYTTNFPKMDFGYNSGGHGNFWDYNRLRRYY